MRLALAALLSASLVACTDQGGPNTRQVRVTEVTDKWRGSERCCPIP